MAKGLSDNEKSILRLIKYMENYKKKLKNGSLLANKETVGIYAFIIKKSIEIKKIGALKYNKKLIEKTKKKLYDNLNFSVILKTFSAREKLLKKRLERATSEKEKKKIKAKRLYLIKSIYRSLERLQERNLIKIKKEKNGRKIKDVDFTPKGLKIVKSLMVE